MFWNVFMTVVFVLASLGLIAMGAITALVIVGLIIQAIKGDK